MARIILALCAAGVVASGGSFFVGKWKGYNNGVAHERSVQAEARARTQSELDRLGEKVAQQAGELLAIKRERESLVQSLENEALSAAGADRPGVADTGGLHRLEQRWGQP